MLKSYQYRVLGRYSFLLSVILFGTFVFSFFIDEPSRYMPAFDYAVRYNFYTFIVENRWYLLVGSFIIALLGKKSLTVAYSLEFPNTYKREIDSKHKEVKGELSRKDLSTIVAGTIVLCVVVAIIGFAINKQRSFDNEIVLPTKGQSIQSDHHIEARSGSLFQFIEYSQGSCSSPTLFGDEIRSAWRGDNLPSFCVEDRRDGRHVFFDNDEKTRQSKESFAEYVQLGVNHLIEEADKIDQKTKSWEAK